MRADYVVVGSGSAGSALAYRLSESGKNSVLIIEAGGSDVGPFIQMPAALSYPMNMSYYDWGYTSEKEPNLHNRQLAAPRGKVRGGSSSINGMVYVRGHSKDYDFWQHSGAKGWGYDDVRLYFNRMETWHSGGHGGNAAWRGTSGPLHVTRGTLSNPLHAAFMKAGMQAGYPHTEDYNGEFQEGFGPFDMTVWKGRRWSTANAYLRTALTRSNCNIVRGHVQRIVMHNKRATGIEANIRGKVQTIHANAEVIVCASAFNSPKILMLSGIGPADHLRQKGVHVVHHLPGVGQNLQDHLEIYLQQACKMPITLYKHWNLFSKAIIGAQWLCTKKGLGASNQFESGAFIRANKDVDYPNIQLHFLPIAIRYDGKTATQGHGYQLHVGTMRSPSRGTITLRSSNPSDAPIIKFNYMSHEQDWHDFRAAIRIARTILKQPAFQSFAGEEIQPGEQATSDAAIDEFIRQHAESAYHPCGSVRMGAANDSMAVVDPSCRVIGTQCLRVADSSIFPRVTYGNINAPSIMVGEKAADHILQEQ